jgi:translation initiation factor 1
LALLNWNKKMADICPTCGLPKELCVCESIAKESQTITVSVVKKKFGKKHTIIEGISNTDVNLKDLTKKLKAKFACGGTTKQGLIDLQGDHTKQLRAVLSELGFNANSIVFGKRR